jgi:PAS domain-containing protein
MKNSLLNNYSSGTRDVSAYEPNEMSLGKLISLVHPIDLPVVMSFESKVMEFFNELTIEKMFKYKVRYDYRLKHKDGHYMRVLQQVITIETDDKGAIVKSMGIHSDITDLKNEGLPVLSFLKPEERF